MKNILFAASECVPFIKTGGLADVVGTLPKMFNKEEFDVRVIIPNYTCIPDKYRNNFRYVTHFYMELGHRFDSVHVGIMEYELDGIKFYFVDNEFYFGGAKPCKNEKDKLVDNEHEIYVKLVEKDGSYAIDTNLYQWLGDFKDGIINSDILGYAFEPEERFENPDGTPIIFDEDYLGRHRGLNALPGPFACGCEAEEKLF